MYSLSARTEFFQSLLEIDRELASVAKAASCVCGGVLDVSTGVNRVGWVQWIASMRRDLVFVVDVMFAVNG